MTDTADFAGTTTPPSESDWKPAIPPEVALGDRWLKAASTNSSDIGDARMQRAADQAKIAQAHYLRHIALCLDTLAGMALHQHQQHGDHAHDEQEVPTDAQ